MMVTLVIVDVATTMYVSEQDILNAKKIGWCYSQRNQMQRMIFH